jgi:putative ABC transport system permease protein
VGNVTLTIELALLRLVGATHRQVLRMLRWEGAVVLTATIIGTMIAAVALVMLTSG